MSFYQLRASCWNGGIADVNTLGLSHQSTLLLHFGYRTLPWSDSSGSSLARRFAARDRFPRYGWEPPAMGSWRSPEEEGLYYSFLHE